jgi:hypothetical protein
VAPLTLILVFAALLAGLAWLLLGGRSDAPEPTVRRRAGSRIDYAELEEAERDVQARDASEGRDWGPGAAPPPVA